MRKKPKVHSFIRPDCRERQSEGGREREREKLILRAQIINFGICTMSKDYIFMTLYCTQANT